MGKNEGKSVSQSVRMAWKQQQHLDCRNGPGMASRPGRRLFLLSFSHFFGREMSQPPALVELAPSTSASCNHWPRAPIIRCTKVDGATGSSSVPGAIPAAVGPWVSLSGCKQAKRAVVRLMAAVRIRRQTRSPWGFCPWNKGLLSSGYHGWTGWRRLIDSASFRSQVAHRIWTPFYLKLFCPALPTIPSNYGIQSVIPSLDLG
ncbi:hypothetical protein BO78DRAFT_207582 [Aspergillus sclerotiicarbonarius CBS 121057]|uniref:Uncharacterized protein n=1 Tax=Aspergillus sclerotiicarbonarius (strain CBS 121057 / IBT 28362) TaxID=1448318 RepID=A0A319E904_ASPSB|nr:hypothetical protein BO78DRAFT_207582 [Aspergillus sclerotiicarbonarius CBS 121057]